MRALVACFALAGGALPAAAQTVADFYRGNTIKMIIRTGPGGTYDLYSRLLGKHMAARVPGNPAFVNVYMPAGGGIVAANYMATQAPRDGSVMTMVGIGLPLDQALGLNPSLKIDLRELNWLGSVSSSNQVTVAWYKSPITSLDAARRVEGRLGSTGAGSISQQFPSFYNAFLGTKFRVVLGYTGSPAINLAIERGELDGGGSNGWAQYQIETPRFARDKLIVPIIQAGRRKEPDLPDVPLLLDLAKNDDERAAFAFMTNLAELGRPVATTPGVPADRLAALREAFDATMKDPDFIADVRRQGGDVRPESGDSLAAVVRGMIEAPEDLRARVKAAISSGQ